MIPIKEILCYGYLFTERPPLIEGVWWRYESGGASLPKVVIVDFIDSAFYWKELGENDCEVQHARYSKDVYWSYCEWSDFMQVSSN